MFLHQALRQIRKNYGCALFAAFLLLPTTGLASTGKLTLAWDPCPDTAGYRLHYGSRPGSYDSHIDVGLKTVHTVEGLNQGTYFFVVTAYNRSGGESGYSNEVQFLLPPPPAIDSVSHTSGPAGMQVVIKGRNLQNGMEVTFGNVKAPVVLAGSDWAITAVPEGFSSGPITVRTPGGSAATSNFTVTPVQPSITLPIPAGGAAGAGTIGPHSPLRAGYAVATSKGNMAPYGSAFLTYSQGGSISSGVSLSPAQPVRSARLLVEHLSAGSADSGSDVITGLAIMNPGSMPATLQLTLRDGRGNASASRPLTIAGGAHSAQLIDQLFALPADFGLGSLEISSNQPVSILGLRMAANGSGKLIMTSTPVADPSKTDAAELYFPRMVKGDGYDTQVLLFNTSDREQSGEIVVMTESGELLTSSPYRIPAGGALRSPVDAGAQHQFVAGWIRVVPDQGSGTPAGAELISLTLGDELYTETALPAGAPSHRVLLPADESGDYGTSIALVNPGSGPAQVEIRAVQSDGRPQGKASVTLPPNTALAGYIGDLLENQIPDRFQGHFEIVSAEQFVATSLRTFVSITGDFGFAHLPAVDPAVEPAAPAIFPQVVSGGGYRTEFLFLNPGADPLASQVDFFDTAGKPLAVGAR